LVVDLSASGTKTATFSIQSIDASSNVEGLPIYSNPVTTVDYAMDTVEVDVRSSGSKDVYVGDTEQEVFRFALDDTKSVTIDGRYATVVVNDYLLTDGATKTFYVYADIVGGEGGDEFQLGIKDKKDVVVLQADTNAALSVTGDVAEINSSTAYGKTIKIKEGDMLITKSSDSPTSAFIPNDEKNVTVLVANFNVTNAIDVEDIQLKNVDVTSGWTIDEIKLYVDDRLVDSVVFTDDDGGPVSKYSDTKNNAQSDIKGSATSATFTIKYPAIENPVRTDGYADGEKVVKGIEDFKILKFTVQANNHLMDWILLYQKVKQKI